MGLDSGAESEPEMFGGGVTDDGGQTEGENMFDGGGRAERLRNREKIWINCRDFPRFSFNKAKTGKKTVRVDGKHVVIIVLKSLRKIFKVHFSRIGCSRFS